MISRRKTVKRRSRRQPHFISWMPKASFTLRPFIYSAQDASQEATPSDANTQRPYPIHFFVRGSRYKIAGLFTSNVHLFGVDDPGQILLMGSDAYGRDQFSRFLYGGQISMLAGLIAALFSVSLGIIVGGIAGYYGGWIDEILMRGRRIFPGAALALSVVCRTRRAAPAHFPMASVPAAGRNHGTDRLGATGPADSRRGAEREAAQFCDCGPRLRRL